jgi:mannose-6-phosphate isomerase-like protein (cupin superfamily)
MPPRKINLVEAADRAITRVFDPHIAGDINDSQAKVAKFGARLDWHAHEQEITVDFRDGPVALGEGDFIVVPRGVEHRPRSLTEEPVVLMFEPATTLNAGDAKSGLTVTDLKRL